MRRTCPALAAACSAETPTRIGASLPSPPDGCTPSAEHTHAQHRASGRRKLCTEMMTLMRAGVDADLQRGAGALGPACREPRSSAARGASAARSLPRLRTSAQLVVIHPPRPWFPLVFPPRPWWQADPDRQNLCSLRALILRFAQTAATCVLLHMSRGNLRDL